MDTSAMDIPNSRAIAKQLLVLSQDVENQPFIVQEQGCLAGLVSYIDHPDIDVVLMATRAIQFLSSNPQNKETMQNFPGLINELTKLIARTNSHPRAREFVNCTLDNLEVAEEEECKYDDEIDQENCPNTLNFNSASPVGKPKVQQKTPVEEEVEYRTIKLQIDRMEDEYVVASIRQCLLDTKGVISVSFDDTRGRATIGIKSNNKNITSVLQQVIEDAGSNATPWPPMATNQTESDDLPGYLDESDYGDTDDDTAVTRWGGNSLAARLERKRQEEEKAKQARMISKVSSAFQNASSWLMGW